MRILLLSPGTGQSLEYQPSLGLAYILAYLKANGCPDTHFADHDLVGMRGIRKALKRLRPDVVGINCVTHSRHRSLEMARLAKELVPAAATVLGGIHATFLDRQILEHYPQVDVIVRGEGEQTMLELVRAIEAGRPHRAAPTWSPQPGCGDLGAIQGLSFRRDGQVVQTPPRAKWASLDGLPFPEYIESYSPSECGGRKAASVITSRGCRGACNYCSVPKYWGKPRFRSAANVVDEVQWLVREHGVGYIRFMDDTFSIDMDRAAAICQGILDRGLDIQWRCATRADSVTRELLELMKRSGCIRVAYGIESGSPRMLETIHKQVTVDQVDQACRWTKELGLVLRTCFMVGNIGETRESIEETKALIRRIKPDEYSVSAALHLFPETSVYRYAEQRGFVNESVWLTGEPVREYTLEHPLSRLTDWQMEIMRECGLSHGAWHYLKHVLAVAVRVPPRVLLRSGYHFLGVNAASLLRRLRGGRP